MFGNFDYSVSYRRHCRLHSLLLYLLLLLNLPVNYSSTRCSKFAYCIAGSRFTTQKCFYKCHVYFHILFPAKLHLAKDWTNNQPREAAVTPAPANIHAGTTPRRKRAARQRSCKLPIAESSWSKSIRRLELAGSTRSTFKWPLELHSAHLSASSDCFIAVTWSVRMRNPSLGRHGGNNIIGFMASRPKAYQGFNFEISNPQKWYENNAKNNNNL